MSQNDPKTTSLMTSLKKSTPSNQKTFFQVQTKRLADLFEPLNSSLAQLAEELWRFGIGAMVFWQPKTAVF